MIEVERKYRGSPAVIEAVLAIAEGTGERVEQTDLYLNAPDRDFAVTDEALRLRSTTPADGETRVAITYKGPRATDAEKARTEYEVGVEALGTTAAIFEALGYTEVARVEKQRRRWRWADMEVAVDTLAGGGRYIELERTVTAAATVAAADAKLAEQAAQLGLSDSELEPRSYLEIVLDDAHE
jgi:adenylate cyclase class 2